MADSENFDLQDFLPYLLNIAAEEASLGFQAQYKARYGMLRTEWRVLFHLGRYGDMAAKDICARARIHKTKVSRAVAGLEKRRFLTRETQDHDRRFELLHLTAQGQAAYQDLRTAAQHYNAQLMRQFTPDQSQILHDCLAKLAGIRTAQP